MRAWKWRRTLGKNKGLDVLRMYRAPKVGALVLECEKCQRKLLEDGRGKRLGKIQAAMESAAAEGLPVRVLQVGCMKECPKDGVTVCALVAGDYTLPRPEVVRSAEDVAEFMARQVGVVSEAGIEPATVSLEG